MYEHLERYGLGHRARVHGAVVGIGEQCGLCTYECTHTVALHTLKDAVCIDADVLESRSGLHLDAPGLPRMGQQIEYVLRYRSRTGHTELDAVVLRVIEGAPLNRIAGRIVIVVVNLGYVDLLVLHRPLFC